MGEVIVDSYLLYRSDWWDYDTNISEDVEDVSASDMFDADSDRDEDTQGDLQVYVIRADLQYP